MNVPTVTGYDLLRRTITVPDDLQGEWIVLLIAFQQWQQGRVDTWLPLAQRLEAEVPGLTYYELPTIQPMNIIARTFINEGMRAGIPDPTARERTVTLYTDKRAFCEALGIPTEEDIHVRLIDRAGTVHWGAQGAYSREAGEGLREAVRALAERG